MSNRRPLKGFTLFELMITIAIIGIVAAVGVPAYRSYIDTANMSRVTSNFEEAVRAARNMLAKDTTRNALGFPSQAPPDTEGWAVLFNRTGIEAPGGGPAYIPLTLQMTNRGDAETGAIGVHWIASRRGRAYLVLWRPKYKSLVEQRAVITADSVDISVVERSEN